MSEYAMIGATLLAVSIGVFMVFGSNLNELLGGVKADFRQKRDSGQKQAELNVLAKKQLEAANNQAVVSEPEYLKLPDLVTSIQVSGANGAVKSMANDIRTSAQNAVAEGKMTQAEYQALLDLANQGHRIATILSLIETAFGQSGKSDPAGKDRPYYQEVWFEGQKVSVITLVLSIGYEQHRTEVPPNPLDSSLKMG